MAGLSHRAKGHFPRYGDNPAVCEVIYTDAELEFLKAVDRYQSRTGRKFLALVELMRILLDLGYHK